MKRVGILLNNIGTPDSFEARDVAVYLREFLMDPDVISLRRPFRDLLVKGLIVPFRARKSAAKYKKIWLREGSPLKVYSEAFARSLQVLLGNNFYVRLAMSYGSPSVKEALADLRAHGIERFYFVPLFPQWSEATTEGSCRRILQEVKGQRHEMNVIREFYCKDFFLAPQSELIREFLAQNPVDHLLFSYHSLPEAQIRKQPGCLTSHDCCYRIEACDKPCYRAQCIRTSKLIAERLSLPREFYTSSFQSRLGPSAWIGPSSIETVQDLAARGVKRMAVVCPSFVADCLETLEEIGIELRQRFLQQGGEEFHLIPCLNDQPQWVKSFAQQISHKSST